MASNAKKVQQRVASRAAILQNIDSARSLFQVGPPCSQNLMSVEVAPYQVPAYHKTPLLEISFNITDADEVLNVQKLICCLLHNVTLVDQQQAFELYLNLIKTFHAQIFQVLDTFLNDYDFKVVIVSIDDFVDAYANFFDISTVAGYETLLTKHVNFVMGIASNLIGKHLNSLNYSNWYSAREKSYAAKCDVGLSDPMITNLRITSDLCSQIYSSVSTKWQIRRKLFMFFYRVANEDRGALSNSLKVTMVLLKSAEMTNFYFILKYILVLNPILMGWNDLAKYAPFVTAAANKFFTMPSYQAFYLKLVLPPAQTTEFQGALLSVPYTVAVAIARQEGLKSSANIQGVLDTANSATVNRALQLLAIYGGANTIGTNAVRAWDLDGLPNIRMREALSYGADEATEEEEKGLEEIQLQ